MNAREAGFLLLTSQLGIPGRKTLTIPQLRTLAKRVRQAEWQNREADLQLADLVALGYSRDMASRILVLLEDGELLRYYCQRGKNAGCLPLSRVSEAYPQALRRALGLDSPGCLWYKGDLSILRMPAISLVGSRELQPENRAFAREVGRQAALQDYALVSGNARGADQEAQNACLQAGGKVISVVADVLAEHGERKNVLYLSEEDFDAPFSAQRALRRNRVIHALGKYTFVAQCGLQTGGTWDGTTNNLRHGWSKVYCFADKSPSVAQLCQMGAETVTAAQLQNIKALASGTAGFLDENWEESL